MKYVSFLDGGFVWDLRRRTVVGSLFCVDGQGGGSREQQYLPSFPHVVRTCGCFR